VYLALDEELSREVALKRMRRSHADDAGRRRFLREGEITGSLKHPGVVPVHGLIRDAEGEPCYAMRFVRGQTLQEAIVCFHATEEAGGGSGLALRQLLSRLVAVCNTVAYAHSRGVIHRDLKPDNIMLGDYGETLVVDWGLAKRLDPAGESHPGEDDSSRSATAVKEDKTHPGAVLGTPAYMSPEQAAGRTDLVGPACDIYSLGATLYALLIGRPPFARESLEEVLLKVQCGDFAPPRHVRPDTPRALQAICLKAMARESAARYATALELAADLERWLGDEPVSAYREPLTARARRWTRRHRTQVTAVAILLTTALVVGWIGAIVAGRERARASALGRVDALRVAAPPAVQSLLDNLDASDAKVVERLRQLWDQEDLPDSQRRRVGLALLPTDSGAVNDRLLRMMLEADDAQEMLLLRDRLAPYVAERRAAMWVQARQPTTDAAGQLRLLVALAAFDLKSANWLDVAGRVVELLLTTNPLQRGAWTSALEPVRAALIPPLSRAAIAMHTADKAFWQRRSWRIMPPISPLSSLRHCSKPVRSSTPPCGQSSAPIQTKP
jgi:tRNA A-37 threonylcarbamoyl transferase component Bud32